MKLLKTNGTSIVFTLFYVSSVLGTLDFGWFSQTAGRHLKNEGVYKHQIYFCFPDKRESSP